MARFDLKRVWADIVQYRRAYILTAVASFGGMLFGWGRQILRSPTHSRALYAKLSFTDTGLIGAWSSNTLFGYLSLTITTGGVLTMDAFQHSFNLNKGSPDFANLQGNIVSVLQVRLG
jgi:SP family sugar:H+ symporter-like MFS transporter